jgi:PTS system nitrogen regulatory IIA component
MNLGDFLAGDAVAFDLKVADKARLLRELADRAAARLKLDPKQLAVDLEHRETLGSTGIGNGVALPHARIQGLKAPFGYFAKLKRPIEYDSIDDKPVDLVFLLLTPMGAQTEHLNALAAIARRMREPQRLQALRDAASPQMLYRAITTERSGP